MWVRFATMDDLEAIKFLADTHPDSAGIMFRVLLASMIDREQILVVEIDQCIVGFLSYRLCRASQILLSKLCVAKLYRGQGLEKQLIWALRNVAIQYQKTSIFVKAWANSPLNRIYPQCGFALLLHELGKQPFLFWKFTWIGTF